MNLVTPIRVTGGFAAGAAALAAALLLGQSRSDASISTDDALSIAEQAITAQQQVIVPPTAQPAASLAGRSAPRTLARHQVVHPTREQLGRMQATGTRRLSRVFAGQALTHAQKGLTRAVAQEQAPNFVVFDGGASNFTLLDSSANSDGTVTVKLRADTFSEMGQVQGDTVVVARPVNTILFTARVEKTPDGLRVTRDDWSFAPGSAP